MSVPSSRSVDGSATLEQIWAMEAAMKKRRIVVAMVLVLLSGCAGRTGSSALGESAFLTAQAHCEKDRGTWHANLGVCEVCP